MAFLPNLFLEHAHRLRSDCLLADGRRFRRRFLRGWLLSRVLLRNSPLLISQLLLRRHLLAGGSRRLRRLLLTFLLGGHTRSLPPALDNLFSPPVVICDGIQRGHLRLCVAPIKGVPPSL